MKFLKYFLLILINLPLIAGNGSVYSRFGLGELSNTHSARRLALGGLGSAITDVYNISSYNPASWHKINLMRFDFGLDYSGVNANSNTADNFSSEYSFSGFVLSVPVQKDFGITITGGLLPVTEVDYSITESSFDAIPGNYDAKYTGDGGLSKVFIGSSYKTPFGFALGASFDYYSGKTEYSSETTFSSSANLNNSKFTTQLKNRGVGFSAGIITQDLSELFGLSSIKELRFGANVSHIANLSVDTAYIRSNAGIGSTQTDHSTIDVKVPLKLGAGMSFVLNERYMIALDYFYQPWSKYKFNGVKSNYLRDLVKVSAGVEYSNPTKKYGSFWEQMIYRGGLSYEQTQYEINGEGIDLYSVHGGVSFPVSPGNTLDIGLQYGLRGTKDSNLVKENILKATVTLSFGELWFVRRER